MSNFVQKLADASRQSSSLLCVGLDPDPQLMPIGDVAEFNKAIVDATKDLVCAFKPNLPFYEALGIPGLQALEATVSHIRSSAPDVLIVGDSKRGDIASTNVFYARSLFEVWDFDAVTVNAYAGGESLEPFLAYGDRGVFVWCRSSNPGAREFQDLRLAYDTGERISTNGTKSRALYQHVAERSSQWDASGNVGLVIGATYPDEVNELRRLCPEMPFLLPGIGAQGGDLENALKSGLSSDVHNVLIASSRGVTYASRESSDYEDAARSAALNLRDEINRILIQEGRGWSSN